MKTQIAIALAIAGAPAAAQQWVEVAKSSETRYQIRAGSVERATNKAGQALTVVVGQTVDRDGSINVYRWYVTDAHCDAGIGELVTLRANGTHAFDVDWTAGGTSIASTIAGLICAARESRPAPSRGFQPIGRF